MDLDESVVSSLAPHKAAAGRKEPASGGSSPHLYPNPASTGTEGSENRRGYQKSVVTVKLGYEKVF